MGAYGAQQFAPLPFASLGAGLRTAFGTFIPPGSLVSFVRSSGQVDYDPPEIASRLFTTLNAALGQCRSGRGDIVMVLPGHTESISAADQMSNLVAGTKIIGVGDGDERPTFTWTVAASTFLLDVVNVRLENLILNLEPGTGTVTVAAPITVSAAGCRIDGCRVRSGTDANNKVTIGITTTAGADRFKFIGNVVRGAALATQTTFLRIVGGDSIEVAYNDIVAGTTSAAVGVIQALTTAPTNINIHDNYLQNNAASSTAALTGVAGMTGWVANNRLRNMTDASVAHFATPGNTQGFDNKGVNNDGEYGILVGTASV